MQPLPLAFSHVGATVPDVRAALTWYRDILGYYVLAGPLEVLEDETPLGRAAARIYGTGFSRFQFAHLATADGVGLELFQFDNPRSARRDDNFEFWKGGIFHLAVTTPDIALLAQRIVDAGGRQRSEIVTIDEARHIAIVYCEDPWGTVIEVCSHVYPFTWASGPIA